jgi:DNA-binding transcriptional ArsR family regulator
VITHASHHACHLRHPPKRTSRGGITGQDADLLVHIAVGGLRSSELAEHLGLARSTVSEAVARLRTLGLVVSRDCATDRREKPLGFRSAAAVPFHGPLRVQIYDAQVLRAACRCGDRYARWLTRSVTRWSSLRQVFWRVQTYSGLDFVLAPSDGIIGE